MNKVLAEIIAGLIPHKMTRNKWRGILRYLECYQDETSDEE